MPTRLARAAALAILLAAACDPPRVGLSISAPLPATPGVAVAISAASVGPDGEVVVAYELARDGKPVSPAAAAALQPAFTIAALDADPATGQPAWKSYLANGAGPMDVPLSPPGTGAGALVLLRGVRQPGFEASGQFAAVADGRFTYRFTQHLDRSPGAAWESSYRPALPLRIGLFLRGTPGTARTSATFDFRADGGALPERELVVEGRCGGCHGTVRAHGGLRTGPRLCVTCHTLQNADPDTIDPAAMAGATAASNPNPLDFGRLVHRIHRGRFLPTLFQSSSTAAAPPFGGPLPLPFNPTRNLPRPGAKFGVIGLQSREFVFGRAEARTDNGMMVPWNTTGGVGFPRDGRDCEACHGGAPREAAVMTELHRRTCQGCHPDAWFGDTSGVPAVDPVHFAHTGQPQPDDSRCATCHAGPGARAPMAAIHVPPYLAVPYDPLVLEILDVRDLQAGKSPTLTFRIRDRVGVLTSLDAPTPAFEDGGSPIARKLQVLILVLGGPTREYATGNFADPLVAPGQELLFNAAAALAPPGQLSSDGAGRFTYTFKLKLPADASGTWALGMEARRRAVVPPYDAATDTFRWPYTGELVSETAVDNPLVYVDTATGVLGTGAPEPRRTVVERAKCETCHRRLSGHGELRHNPSYCLVCHTGDRTDWGRRPKENGNTHLDATYDGVEERSVHFDVMVHRIHTGGHVGSAQTPKPFVVYGNGGVPWFFDDVEFPGNLSDCRTCHATGAYRLESLPAEALPTTANESPTLLHAATPALPPGTPRTGPATAACLACHGSANSALHAAQYTTATGEGCIGCHGETAASSVNKVHGVPLP